MEEKKKDIDNYEKAREHIISLVKEYIEQEEMSITRFARKCGMTQSAMSKLLNGQSTITLKHILMFAEVMKCDPGLLLIQQKSAYNYLKKRTFDDGEIPAQSLVVDASSEGLITACDRFSFKGMLGEYKFYSYPTISTEFKPLYGTLTLQMSDTKDRYCITTLKIDTGTVDERGDKVYKEYTGQTINSLPMQCSFATLISVDNADFVFLSWHHRFVNSKLQCRMAAALTASAGSERRPVMLKTIMSRIPLDDDDLATLLGEMKMNSGSIVVKKDDFDRLCKESIITADEQKLFVKEVFPEKDPFEVYNIPENRISTLVSLETDRKNELIGILRNESMNSRYTKISNMSDTRLYEYVIKKQREQYKLNNKE